MRAAEHILVGFGFGPIQSGLFLREAAAGQAFARLVVAEIDQALVDAVRANGNRYVVNVAHADGIRRETIDGVEMFNPRLPEDRECLRQALAAATEIATSLPSVKFYALGEPSVARLIAEGLVSSAAPVTRIYTAENNNHAAEALEAAVTASGAGAPGRPVAYLNTVIGKMSQVVSDADAIAGLGLERMAPGLDRAFLVEAFNHILVTRDTLDGLPPGISVFEAKADLLPFEEAKLYGHNAIHALIAYLAEYRGCGRMSDAAADPVVMAVARAAFLDESGAALIRKYAALGDRLFTPSGYRAYAEDLMLRITNPHLSDAVARAGRDPVRKLGLTDRIYGAMTLALEQGVTPVNLGKGAAAGLLKLIATPDAYGVPAELRGAPGAQDEQRRAPLLLDWLWNGAATPHRAALIALTCDGLRWLRTVRPGA
jgi:mannitol-1-phosphate 5-dehydrogenase